MRRSAFCYAVGFVQLILHICAVLSDLFINNDLLVYLYFLLHL